MPHRLKVGFGRHGTAIGAGQHSLYELRSRFLLQDKDPLVLCSTQEWEEQIALSRRTATRNLFEYLKRRFDPSGARMVQEPVPKLRNAV